MSTVQAHIFAEYEEMLKSFRCQDLANLLAYAGQSKNGKKSELYDRCINILKKGNASIQLKIREIYNNKVSTTCGNNYTSLMSAITNHNSNSGSNSPDPSMLNRYQSSSTVSTVSAALSYSSGQASSIPPFNQYDANQQRMSSSSGGLLNTAQYNQYGACNTRSANSGAAGMYGQQQSNNHNIRVQFERLAFFQYLHELSPPVKLIPINLTSRPFAFWFNFFMNTDQANEITGTREMIGGKLEYSKQIHLRFGFYEHTLQQVDNLPANLMVSVNGKPAQLPIPKPTSKPNADIIRPGRSIDVTSLCKLAPNQANKVEIHWTNTDATKSYCVGTYVFKKVSVASLVQNLKTNCVADSNVTRQMVKDKLQISDSDLEIETSELKVSLMCPLMKFRMQLPGRARKCKHVQCFDIQSYLMMNEKKPTWNCPVCDQHTPYDDLIIDSLFEEIISKCTDVEEVQFQSDGTWSKIKIGSGSNASASTASSSKNARQSLNSSLNESNGDTSCQSLNTTPIKMDEESCVDICDETSPPTTATHQQQTTAVASGKNLDIIDLTLDSDEETPPPPSNRQTAQQQITRMNSVGKSTSGQITRSNSQSSTLSSTSNFNSNEAQVCSTESNQFTEDTQFSHTNKSNQNKEARNGNQSPNMSIISISSNSSAASSRSQTPVPSEMPSSNILNQNHMDNINTILANFPCASSRINEFINDDVPNNSSFFSNFDKSKTPTTNQQTPKSTSISSSPSKNNTTNSSTMINSSSNNVGTNSMTGLLLTSSSSSKSEIRASSLDLRMTTPPPLENKTTQSNSELARGLSMPSPNRNLTPPVQQSNLSSSNLAVNKSLTSIPNIIETANQCNNLLNKSNGKQQQQPTSSSSSLCTNKPPPSPSQNKIQQQQQQQQQRQPTVTSNAPHQNSVIRPAPLIPVSHQFNTSPSSSSKPSSNNSALPASVAVRSTQQSTQSIPKQQENYNRQHQQQQQFSHNSNNSQPHRQIEHSLINSNSKISNNKLPHKKPEYINKEKAMIITDELKSMASNPNLGMVGLNKTSPNGGKNAQSTINNSNFNLKESNLSAKIANTLHRNSFDTDLPSQLIHTNKALVGNNSSYPNNKNVSTSNKQQSNQQQHQYNNNNNNNMPNQNRNNQMEVVTPNKNTMPGTSASLGGGGGAPPFFLNNNNNINKNQNYSIGQHPPNLKQGVNRSQMSSGGYQCMNNFTPQLNKIPTPNNISPTAVAAGTINNQRLSSPHQQHLQQQQQQQQHHHHHHLHNNRQMPYQAVSGASYNSNQQSNNNNFNQFSNQNIQTIQQQNKIRQQQQQQHSAKNHN